MATYSYRRLSTEHSIRTLDLQPGLPGSIIQIEIQEHDVNDCPPFSALSYSWSDANGNGMLCELIHCRGKAKRPEAWRELLVTKNCLAALNRLRHAQEVLTLWVDAICIDQSNGREKDVQIPLMREIYTSADQVVLWIGESTAHSDEALSFIRDIAQETRKARDWGIAISEQPLLRQLMHAAGSGYTQAITAQGGLFGDIFEIFQRSWWKRVWIIQEVALAKDPWLVCGGARIPYRDIETITEALREVTTTHGPSRLAALTYHVTTQTRMRSFIQGKRTAPWQSLTDKTLYALRLARRCETAAARDRVFGIQGLFGPDEITLPFPDTKKSTAQVYAEVALSLILSTGSLDVLSDCSGESRIPGLPRWAPDWTLRDLNAFRTELYDAGRSSRAEVTFSTGSHVHILMVKGIFVDSLQLISTHAEPARSTEDRHQYPYDLDCIHVWRIWLDLLRRVSPAAAAATEWAAFWRTLCFDSPPGLEMRAPESFGDAAHSWRQIMLDGRADGAEAVSEKLRTDEQARFYYDRVRTGTVERALARTANGRWALVPSYAYPGDRIVLLGGGRVPHIVREDEKGRHIYVGSCYVHGIMDGEAFPGKEALDDITLC